MKTAIVLFALLWLLCGVVGASMLGDLEDASWKVIARGPMTLIEAINGNAVRIPAISD